MPSSFLPRQQLLLRLVRLLDDELAVSKSPVSQVQVASGNSI
jgi:hypothetical protein